MSHRELSRAQFRGVLHGHDPESGSTYSAPYEVDNRAEILEHARRLQADHPEVQWTEHSHEGTCDEAGCKIGA